jgi:hypothetical protein
MAMTGLPAYSGPRIPCPKCGVSGVLTEWHRAGGCLAPGKMSGREPPCNNRDDLAAIGGKGEHLCRLCVNCGYGWVEACAPSRGAGPLRAVPDTEETGECPG